jgi:hypothetical protein
MSMHSTRRQALPACCEALVPRTARAPQQHHQPLMALASAAALQLTVRQPLQQQQQQHVAGACTPLAKRLTAGVLLCCTLL